MNEWNEIDVRFFICLSGKKNLDLGVFTFCPNLK